VLDLLTSLADKSVVAAEERRGRTRYRFLETVRHYARDRLLEAGEGEQWRGRHLEYFVTLGEEAEQHITGAEQQAWLDRLEVEHDNLRAALEWSVGSDPEAGLQLAGTLWRFWLVRGHSGEGRALLDALLAAAEPDRRTAERARAINGAGALAYRQGDYPAARTFHEKSLEIRKELGDRGGIALSLQNLGSVALWQGDYAAARVLLKESVGICRELGDRKGIAMSLEWLAVAEAPLGQAIPAARLWGVAERLREEVGSPLPPNERPRYEQQVAAARVALGDDAAFAAAWAEGRATPLEQAIECALDEAERDPAR
jgi:non-specific serine/threonine protein kinase